MEQKENMISMSTINERDKRVIQLVTRLTDKELFGLECFLAGTRAGAFNMEKQNEKE